MAQNERGDVTRLLESLGRGERSAEEQLIGLVYAELRRIAARYMRAERKGHSLQPTALVHEAYIRLISRHGKPLKNRVHFFAIAALVMRQILVDHARRHRAAKRGHGKRVSLDSGAIRESSDAAIDPEESEDLIALDDALTELATRNARQSRILELRFFAGLTVKEIARALDVSERTVEREAAAAQAWLYTRLRPPP
jgi:RNA polymerase sigma factor (TIGR02999 family)